MRAVPVTPQQVMFTVCGQCPSLHTEGLRELFFKKVITETILKIYNTLVLPTFLCGSENWTLRALQRQRIEAAEMKLLWQATPFVTTKQMTTYATNCGLQAY